MNTDVHITSRWDSISVMMGLRDIQTQQKLENQLTLHGISLSTAHYLPNPLPNLCPDFNFNLVPQEFDGHELVVKLEK
eukprot:79645-Amphidinium_carterae.1